MKANGKEILYKQGFLRVEDFVRENILDSQSENCDENGCKRVLSMNQYFQASSHFHQPGGDGYKLVLNCLQKYLDFKFIRENNNFRFDEVLFDQRVSIIPSNSKGRCDYVIHDDESISYEDGLEGTRADIYYLLNEADQNGIASRRCIDYVHSNRLHLTAVLVQLIERAVDNLERDNLKRHREYARVLRVAFMTPEYAELDVYSLFEILACTKKQYYRLRNAAISLLSETLFGVFAGENGFADLFIRDNEIKIP